MDKRSQYMTNDNQNRSIYMKGDAGAGSPVFRVTSAASSPSTEMSPSSSDQNPLKATSEAANPEQKNQSTTSSTSDDAQRYPKKSVLEIDIKKPTVIETDSVPATKVPSASGGTSETRSPSRDQSPTSSSKVKSLIDFYENKSSPTSSPDVKRTGKSWSSKSSMSTTPSSSKSTESENSSPGQSIKHDDSNSPTVAPKDKKEGTIQSDTSTATKDLKVKILPEDKQGTTSEEAESSRKKCQDGHHNVTEKSPGDEDFKNMVILCLAVLILVLLTFAICAK